MGGRDGVVEREKEAQLSVVVGAVRVRWLRVANGDGERRERRVWPPLFRLFCFLFSFFFFFVSEHQRADESKEQRGKHAADIQYDTSITPNPH